MPTSTRIQATLPAAFVTLAQISKRVSASRKSVRRWLNAAGVPAFYLGDGRNGSVRYAADAVETWLLSRKGAP